MIGRMGTQLMVVAALARSWVAVPAGAMTPSDDRTVGGAREEGGSDEGKDRWITAQIKTHIFNTDALNGSDISVDTKNGVVTLGGTVPSEKGRERAVELARATDGVERVVDHLRIGRF